MVAYSQQENGTELSKLFYGCVISSDSLDEDDDAFIPTGPISKSLKRPLPIGINTKSRPKQTVTVTLLCVPRDDVHTSTMTRPVIKVARVMTPGVKN